MPSPPLIDLFNHLRNAGLPLGINEYQLMLKALQGGFGLQNRTALLRLCETLWTKSDEEKQLLYQYFDQLLPLESEPEPLPPVPLFPRLFLRTINGWAIARVLAVGISIAAIVGYYATRPTVTQTTTDVPASPNPTPVPGTPNGNPVPPPAAPPPPLVPNPTDIFLLPPWMLGVLMAIVALSGGLLTWWLSQWLLKRNLSQPPKQLSDQFSGATTAIHDEIAAAQAQERSISETSHQLWIATPDMPTTERQMKRSWRYLSRPVRIGSPTELDLEATIQKIGRQGLLLDPVLVPPRTNRAALLFLVDRDGSMEPFHTLTDRLITTAHRGGRFGWTQVSYFHNCPTGYLYRDSYRSDGERWETVFERLPLRQLSTLIVSDAGATRGSYNAYRMEKTQEFLSFLYKRVRYVAWLNPLPSDEWQGTTAAEIAKHIPMFGCDRTGLDNAIKVLRGKKGRAEL